MLDAIKKKLGMDQVVKEKEPEMTTENKQASAEMTAQLAELTEKFSAKEAELSALLEKTASLEAALKEAQEFKAKAEAEAKAVKMAARKTAVEANLGTVKAAEFLAATEALDDKTFETLCSAMATSLKAEAESPLFKEVGVDAKTDVTVETDAAARLAAALKAEINPK